MKLKRLASLLLAALLLVSSIPAIAEEGIKSPIEQEQYVEEYSNYMIKSMIRAYSHTIAENYYYGVDDEELLFSVICQGIDNGKIDVNTALKGMISTLKDEHSEYYSPEEYKATYEEVSGEFSGIGVTILSNSKGVVVTSVINNSPALKAGIMAGDYIVSIDGKSTEGLNATQVRTLVVGLNATEVKVGIKRGESLLEFSCARAKVEVPQTESRMLTDDIAYLKLAQFTSGAADEVKEYVDELKQNNIEKLVLDVRNNPGGELESAIKIGEIFIGAGKIGEIRYKDKTKNEVIYSKNYHKPDLDIVLLVNERSASASEFLSAAFQGRKAATLIGEKTYGKGSMQALMKAPTGAGMKYTIGEFFDYKGKRVHTVGITPDIVVENIKKKVDESKFEEIDINKTPEGGKDGSMNLALEQRLSALGYLIGKPDSTYDKETTEAVCELQNTLGYESTGVPGFYEYLYLKDYNYDFETVEDKQLEEAVNYLKRQ